MSLVVAFFLVTIALLIPTSIELMLAPIRINNARSISPIITINRVMPKAHFPRNKDFIPDKINIKASKPIINPKPITNNIPIKIGKNTIGFFLKSVQLFFNNKL